jgi:ATP phosphoribosyltransferase
MSIAVAGESHYRSPLDLPPHSRIASKYVGCARAYFDSIDLPVEIIPLYGSVELGPITGMAEAIVDLVSTGKTLKDNGLIEIEVLYHSTARLIGHPLSYRLYSDRFSELMNKMQLKSKD